ncbi:MAG: hypothetical protein K6B52_05110 [Clostridiales bacterium]|nr:hypothetical protein [Clostridiales bacterium]
MLGKLIKNEFKSNLHSIGLIYVVALVCMAFMALSYVFKIQWISIVATIVLIFAGILAVVVTFGCVVLNFQKTLYKDQGYLSFTLPVTSGQLLTAKAICSFTWMLISYAVALGVFIGVYLYSSAMVGDDVKMAANLLLTVFADLPSKKIIIEVIALLCLSMFVMMVLLIAEIYFAITVANTRLLQKWGVFSGIITFFVTFFATSAASFYLTQKIPFTLVVTSSGIYYSTMATMTNGTVGLQFGLAGFIFNIAMIAVLFTLTSRLMNTKVNIK